MTNTAQLSQKVYLSIETKHGTVQIEIQILLNFWTINGMEIKILSISSLYYSILRRAGWTEWMKNIPLSKSKWHGQQNPESANLEKNLTRIIIHTCSTYNTRKH